MKSTRFCTRNLHDSQLIRALEVHDNNMLWTENRVNKGPDVLLAERLFHYIMLSQRLHGNAYNSNLRTTDKSEADQCR